MQYKQLLKIIFTTLTVLIIIFIFSNSAQSAAKSGSQSQKATELINELLDEANVPVQATDHIIRKSAHFIEYMLLGMCVFAAVSIHTKSHRTRTSISWVILLTTACADELLQLFFDGRSGQISDVLLDLSGSAAGYLFMFLIVKMITSMLCKKKLKFNDCPKYFKWK